MTQDIIAAWQREEADLDSRIRKKRRVIQKLKAELRREQDEKDNLSARRAEMRTALRGLNTEQPDRFSAEDRRVYVAQCLADGPLRPIELQSAMSARGHIVSREAAQLWLQTGVREGQCVKVARGVYALKEGWP
jgi:hypothetical protein